MGLSLRSAVVTATLDQEESQDLRNRNSERTVLLALVVARELQKNNHLWGRLRDLVINGHTVYAQDSEGTKSDPPQCLDELNHWFVKSLNAGLTFFFTNKDGVETNIAEKVPVIQ